MANMKIQRVKLHNYKVQLKGEQSPRKIRLDEDHISQHGSALKAVAYVTLSKIEDVIEMVS